MAKKPKDDGEIYEICVGTVIAGDLKIKGDRVQLDRSVAADWLIMGRIRRIPGYNRRDMNPRDP